MIACEDGGFSNEQPPPCLRCGLLLGSAQNGAQSLPDNDFFSGFDGHRNQFDVVGRLAFFAIRIRVALANSLDQTWIVRPEHFDDWIPRAQFLHAIGNTKSPCLLVPGLHLRIFFGQNLPQAHAGDYFGVGQMSHDLADAPFFRFGDKVEFGTSRAGNRNGHQLRPAAESFRLD